MSFVFFGSAVIQRGPHHGVKVADDLVPLHQIPFIVSEAYPIRAWRGVYLLPAWSLDTDCRVEKGSADRQDFPTITFNEHESIEMPFRKCQHRPHISLARDGCFRYFKRLFSISPRHIRLHTLYQAMKVPTLIPGYVKDSQGEPILPPGMKDHLKADLDRTIDDF